MQMKPPIREIIATGKNTSQPKNNAIIGEIIATTNPRFECFRKERMWFHRRKPESGGYAERALSINDGVMPDVADGKFEMVGVNKASTKGQA
jgi:hypothetical protein